MRMNIEDGALCGNDGRIIYADITTARLYALLTPSVRRDVRGMMRTSWQGSWELEPKDLTDATGIVSATIRISDCVARCRIVMGPTLAARDRVTVDGHEVTIPGGLPDTIVATIRRKDLGEVTGVPMLAGLKVSHVRSEANPLILLWDGLPCHLIDPEGLAEDDTRKEFRDRIMAA